MIKAFNVTFGILVAFSVWCGAVLFAALVLRLMTVGGSTLYQLMNP